MVLGRNARLVISTYNRLLLVSCSFLGCQNHFSVFVILFDSVNEHGDLLLNSVAWIDPCIDRLVEILGLVSFADYFPS